jgi:hypothetical protein
MQVWDAWRMTMTMDESETKMIRTHYLISLCLAMISLLLGGCAAFGFGQTAPTPVPFALYSAQTVIDAFTNNGAPIANVQRSTLIGRGAPNTFSERYTFEVPRIAPNGGQILVFDTAEALAEWQTYIEQLRNDPAQRRSVIYVYVRRNVMVQINAELTNSEARRYEEILNGLP